MTRPVEEFQLLEEESESTSRRPSWSRRRSRRRTWYYYAGGAAILLVLLGLFASVHKPNPARLATQDEKISVDLEQDEQANTNARPTSTLASVSDVADTAEGGVIPLASSSELPAEPITFISAAISSMTTTARMNTELINSMADTTIAEPTPTSTETEIVDPSAVTTASEPTPTTTVAFLSPQRVESISQASDVLLWTGFSTLTSPNGLYNLRLTVEGDLVLEQKDTAQNWTRVWRTNTGSQCCSAEAGSNFVTLGGDGTLHVFVKQSLNVSPTLHELWHSGLLSQCKDSRAGQGSGIHRRGEPLISLDNSGYLQTLNEDGHPACVIFPGVLTELEPKEEFGRLAIVLSGTYAALPQTCQSQSDKLIKSWPGTGVDVFVLAYSENTDPSERQRQQGVIKSCFGDALRSLLIASESKMTTSFTGEPVRACPSSHLDALSTELKIQADSAALLQSHILKTGAQYKKVLRLRTDTYFLSNPPAWPSGMDRSTLVLFQPYEARFIYCPTVAGGMTTAASDQLVYGSMSAMMNFFNMYHHFAQIIAGGSEGSAYRPFSGCAELPAGSQLSECKQPIPCALDCLLPYYLSLMGVDYEVDWTWKQDVLKPNGELAISHMRFSEPFTDS